MTAAQDNLEATVLIVDDNEQNVELLQAYMEEIAGVKTFTVADGVAALRAVRTHKPDLILLDIMMPKMSGYEVCTHLKQDAGTRNIPVIMITALNEPSDYERGMESGADDFMTRPLNRVEFVARVRSLLRLCKMRQEFDQNNAGG